MIIFINTYLTSRRWTPQDRGLLGPVDALEIFRLMIRSLKGISATKVYCYAELDPQAYDESCKTLVEQELEDAFREIEIEYRARRLIEMREWRAFLDREVLPRNEVVLYCGNHDHVFVDRDTSVLDACVARLERLAAENERASVAYSHWSEFFPLRGGAIEKGSYGFMRQGTFRDAVQILTPRLLRSWFYDEQGNVPPHKVVRRTEDLGDQSPLKFKQIVPARELFRHADGDSHFGVLPDQVPPLHVPCGTMNRELKIAFILDSDPELVARYRSAGYVCSSPLFPSVAVDPGGADFHWLPDELPAFIRNSTAETVTVGSSSETVFEARDERYASMLTSTLPVDAATLGSLSPSAVRSSCEKSRRQLIRPRPSGERRSESFSVLRRTWTKRHRAIVCFGVSGYAEEPARWEERGDDATHLVYVWVRERRQNAWLCPMSVNNFSPTHQQLFSGIYLYEYDFTPNYFAALRRVLSDLCVSEVELMVENLASGSDEHSAMGDVATPSRPLGAISLPVEVLRKLLETEPNLFAEDYFDLAGALVPLIR
jgi:hypothetical protein